MKLKSILILTLLMAAMNSSATKRSAAEMRMVAEQYLGISAARAVKGSSAAISLQTLEEKEMLTMIGNEENGFVIVANDDFFPAVIGYSHEPFTTVPPALTWYLNEADKCMQERIKMQASYAPVPPSSEFAESMEPLLTTTWNQGKPYNNLCPGGNGSSTKLFPTGCVATALSQIMYYHKYPEVGIGDHQYSFKPASGDGRVISANFGETHYDWNNMIDDYSKTYTDEQANAVATLMLHCGVAVEMNYSSSGSGSYPCEACLGLKKFFGYNENARVYYREYYSAELWMKMVYRELNLKRPMYYAGVSTGDGGHAFVIDGYNKEGLVHVNWGWGGNSNGMYDIALLNPSSYQFVNGQTMITGICDSTVAIPYESQVVADEINFTFSGTKTKRLTIQANRMFDAAAEKFVGRIKAILENEETTIVLKNALGLNEEETDIELNPILGGTYFVKSLTLRSINLSEIPDGTYRLYVGTKTEKDSRWQLLRTLEGKVNSYIIVKNGDELTCTEDCSDLWSDPTTTGVASVKIGQSRNHNNIIYDLLGREVKMPRKGIYIQNGRKIVR